MDEMKKYVDYAGLKHYDELIKKFIKEGNTDAIEALVALIGAAEKGENEATLIARIAALETAVGNVSELGDDVANLTKAILGESSRAQDAEDDLQDAIDALDTALHGDSEAEAGTDAAKGELKVVEDTAKAYTDAEIEKLDADEDATDAGVTVGVTEEDGVITAVSVEVADNEVKYVAATTGENAEAAKVTVADTTAVLKGDAVAEILKYVDAMDAANSGDAAAELKELKEALYGAEDDDNDDGKLGEIDSRLDDLEALHADKKDAEGKVTGKQTVKDEVDAGIAALVAGAPEALDTLKEIADWIANSTAEDGVTDAASLISRVDTLTGADTVDGSVAKSIKDAVEALDATVTNRVEKAEGAETDPVQPNVIATISEVDGKLTSVVIDDTVLEGRLTALEGLMGEDSVEDQIKAITGEPDENKTIQDEIDDIEELIGTLPETSDNVIDYVDDSIAALDAEVENQELPATGENFQASGIHVKVTEEAGVLTAVTASINTVTEADIDALFADEDEEEEEKA